jgi:hypothetical protein
VIRGVVAIALLLGACNPVQRISNHANAIRTEAQALEEHGHAIGDPVVVAGAERIDGLAAGIHDELPNVTNKVPAWLSTLQWWGIAVAVVAVAFVLWNSGILSSVRIALGFLPRRKVAQAELALDTLDESRPESARELVAALRSQDAEIDAAYRKAQKRRKAST